MNARCLRSTGSDEAGLTDVAVQVGSHDLQRVQHRTLFQCQGSNGIGFGSPRTRTVPREWLSARRIAGNARAGHMWPSRSSLSHRDDAEVQWHAKHGLVLMAAEPAALPWRSSCNCSSSSRSGPGASRSFPSVPLAGARDARVRDPSSAAEIASSFVESASTSRCSSGAAGGSALRRWRRHAGRRSDAGHRRHSRLSANALPLLRRAGVECRFTPTQSLR